jgi:hypothetical protein
MGVEPIYSVPQTDALTVRLRPQYGIKDLNLKCAYPLPLVIFSAAPMTESGTPLSCYVA